MNWNSNILAERFSCLSYQSNNFNWLEENEHIYIDSHTDNLFLAIVDIIDTIDFGIYCLLSGIGSEILFK